MAMPAQTPGVHNMPLTQLLLTHNPHLFSQATTHTFLHSAGLGTLPKATLSKWLSQDRLYAQSYISFIGALISRVHLPHAFVKDKSTSLRWRILKLLTASLENITKELEFFEDVAQRYGLDLEASPMHWKDGLGSGFQPTGATKQYESLFRAFGADPSMSLLEGLVVLWATEQVYLSAWRYSANLARGRVGSVGSVRRGNGFLSGNGNGNGSGNTGLTSANGNMPRVDENQTPNQNTRVEENRLSNAMPSLMKGMNEKEVFQPHTETPSTSQNLSSHPQSTPPRSNSTADSATAPTTPAPSPYATDLDSGALRSEFIPNWTSEAFEHFVQEIADVTDELAEREEAWRKTDVYKAVWEYVLEVERRFWGDFH
jgi:thiaminase